MTKVIKRRSSIGKRFGSGPMAQREESYKKLFLCGI
jgi:hypothetical protein